MQRIESAILTALPPPREIHEEMGRLLRQVSVLRRLMRLSQAVHDEKRNTEIATPHDGEVSHAK
jgi:hypothetical protein